MNPPFQMHAGLLPPAGTPAEPYARSRGIAVEALEGARCRFAPAWFGAPALVAPIRRPDGSLAGAHGRYLGQARPKCRTEGELGEGLFLSRPDALEGRVVTLCEGLFDALALDGAGLPAAALLGLAWRDWLPERLRGRTVNLAFDADAAGDAAAEDWARRLAPIRTRRLRPEQGKDFADELLAAGAEALKARLEALEAPYPAGYLLSAATLDPRPIEWIWRYHLARGKLTLLEGDPGKGKGLITMDIAARLSRGDAMPDGAACDPCRVLFLTGEDDVADTELPRLLAGGARLGRVFFMKPKEDHGRWDLAADADIIEEQVRDCAAGLLVVDPLTEFLPCVDTHRDNEVRGVLARLRDLAVRCRCAVLAVRHLNKAAGGPALYRGGGSIAFAGAARFVFTVGQDPDDRSRRAFAMTKCNVAPELPTLLYRVVADDEGRPRVEWLGRSSLTSEQVLQPTGPRAGQAAEAFLREALAQGERPAAGLLEEAAEAGISRQTLKRAKAALGAGVVRREGRWHWRLAPAPPEPDEPAE